MSPKNYFTFSGIVFAVVFVLHLLRLINVWDAQIANWTVPMWLSWVVVLLTGFLAWKAYKLHKK